LKNDAEFKYSQSLHKILHTLQKILEPYLSAGPRLDYLISYNENVYFLKAFDDSGQLNKFSYGFIMGCGINSKIKKFRLGAAFDYYLNLNKISDFISEYGYTNKI